MQNNHICKVCDKPYNYCDDCGVFGSYKTVCCSLEHYNIFTIVMSYIKDSDKEKAKLSLKALNLKDSDISLLNNSTKKLVEEIMTYCEKSICKIDVSEEISIKRDKTKKNIKK